MGVRNSHSEDPSVWIASEKFEFIAELRAIVRTGIRLVVSASKYRMSWRRS